MTHVHTERERLAEARTELEAFGPQAIVDTSALTKAHAEAALGAFRGELRLVVLSSVDVYRGYAALRAGRESDAVPFDETSPVREERYPFREQMPEYEKLDVEDAYLARGATVCRLPMVYGERDYQRREWFVLRRVRAGRERIPVGAGNWLTTRAYVGDVAAGVRLALSSDAAAGRVFNLGESRTWTTAGWMRRILDAAGHEAELVRVGDDVLPEDLGSTRGISQHLLADSCKARSMLGWRDSDPDEALRRSVGWHLAHPPEDGGDFKADDEALASVT